MIDQNNSKGRLINLAKSEKIKHYIEKISKNFKKGINVSHSHNTQEAISWFKRKIGKRVSSLNSILWTMKNLTKKFNKKKLELYIH